MNQAINTNGNECMGIYRPLGDFPDSHHSKDHNLEMLRDTTLKQSVDTFQEGHFGAYFLIHFLLNLSK